MKEKRIPVSLDEREVFNEIVYRLSVTESIRQEM
jgi:hypothetical protein